MAFACQGQVVLAEDAFGHVGMGGSIGFADPRAHMSFGYTMNRQGMSVGLDTRGQSLVDATYRALGYHAPVRGSLAPSTTSAMSRILTGAPLRKATIRSR